MTSRVEWKNEQSLEARALYALWRNHPLTAVKDRGGERAHRMARANRDMLLSWAAAQPDYRLRDCRNIGAATLAWIRANQSPTPTGLNVDDLTRFIDDALEDWSTRPDPEPSDQVAVYLARRIAENIVTPPPAEPTLDVLRLARALHNVSYGCEYPSRPSRADAIYHRGHAAAIAREYAALEEPTE